MTTTAPPLVSAPAPDVPPARVFTERSGAFDGRLKGLDGLRALAVVLVVLFHVTPGTTVGGFLGVDIFFVVSGFLITGLLLKEKARTGRVRFRSFWARRARRLLPALVVVTLVCSSVALVLGGDVLVGLGRQLLGAATFSYNWIEIAGGTSYFEGATPELFRNFWSLAVEEQFYLIWPIVVIGIALVPRGRVRVAITLLLAASSAFAMISAFVPDLDATRVYYGTDTHSFGLAIGAALAFLVDARPPSMWTAGVRRGLSLVGALSVVALVGLAIVLPADNPLVYRGGLQLVAVLTALAIAACIVPGGTVGRVLDIAPVRWIGVRSYGLYLWHWPVIVLLMAALPGFTFDDQGLWILGGAAVIVSVAAASLSYRFIEVPIRQRGFRTIARKVGDAAITHRATAVRVSIAAVAVTAVVAMTGMAIIVAPTQGDMESRLIAAQAENAASHDGDVPPAPADEAQPISPGAPATQTVGGLSAMPSGDQMLAVGDSVMLAASAQLRKAYPGIDIRAAVSRQMYSAPEIVKRLADSGKLRPVLVIGLGINGPIERDDVEDVIRIAGPQTSIVLVNAQAPRSWVPGVNKQLAQIAADYRNVELADWRTPIRDNVKELYSDRIHPKTAKGGRIYADAVAAAIERLVVQTSPAVDMTLFAPAG